VLVLYSPDPPFSLCRGSELQEYGDPGWSKIRNLVICQWKEGKPPVAIIMKFLFRLHTMHIENKVGAFIMDSQW